MLHRIGAGAKLVVDVSTDEMNLVRCATPGDWSQALKQADRQVNDWLIRETRQG